MDYTVRTEQVSDDLRIRIEYDQSPDEPFDDGGSPILRFTTSYSRAVDVSQVTETTSYVLPPALVAGFHRVLDEHDLAVAKRYLSIFWGATKFDEEHSRDYSYLTFDPAHWREAMELTDEYLAERKAEGVDVRLADLTEWRAYLNGEVYGYITERQVTWVQKDKPEVERDTWEEIDSCWGFFGDADYAVEAAKENLPE